MLGARNQKRTGTPAINRAADTRRTATLTELNTVNRLSMELEMTPLNQDEKLYQDCEENDIRQC